MHAIIVLVSVLFLAGCSEPCFYRAGTSIGECRHDLLQCIGQVPMLQKSELAQRTRSCMQAKGYECLDAGKASAGLKRIMVRASFGTYWVMDGSSVAPTESQTVAVKREEPQQQPQSVPETPQPKPIGYRARLDENGKHTLIPVYDNEQRSPIGSVPSTNSDQ
jgi:hypothetical protein